MRAVVLLLVAALAWACGDAGGGTSAPPTAVARFEPALSTPIAWGDVPFPSDLYRDDAGTIRLGELPTPLSASPLFDAFRELLAGRDGFCATCNVYFRIDGEVAADQLPADDPARQPSPTDAIVLADVDDASPERGRLFVLRVEWNAATGVLGLRPERGIALHRARRYAAALTSELRASDGTPLAPSAVFRQARDGQTGDATVARVRASIAPALDELERIGVARERVVALAAFTTEDVTADVVAARALVQDGPPLGLTGNASVIRGSAIDELLGLPSEDRPGIDVPPIAGTAGTRSIVHGSIAEVYRGAFAAPRLVTGSGTETGVVRRDASGEIAAGPREPVPFVLTIPAVEDRTNLPLVIAHHGFNASRTTGFATAETAARAGVAVLAIDAFQHGERAVSATDEVNAIRGGLPGPDGYAETQPLDVSGRVFGVLGTAPGLAGFTGYPHATLLQFAADVFSAVRAVRDGVLAEELFERVTPISPIGFDPERIGFIGNSLGAVVGASVLVAEPDVRAAVQNVPPGSIVETLAESPEFRPLVEAIFLPLLGITGPFDEVERHLLLDPIVDLTRWVLEPVDPLALAPYLVRDPLRPAGPAEILFQVAATDEVAAPLPTASMLDASGAPRITRYDPAAHGMLEVLLQESRYEPPVVPPFRLRPAVLPIENPIVDVHLEIGQFLAAQLVGAP